MKKWRALPADIKAPFLTQARENRTKSMRVKKNHQVGNVSILISTSITIIWKYVVYSTYLYIYQW